MEYFSKIAIRVSNRSNDDHRNDYRKNAQIRKISFTYLRNRTSKDVILLQRQEVVFGGREIGNATGPGKGLHPLDPSGDEGQHC